jgi:hypothetical protein
MQNRVRRNKFDHKNFNIFLDSFFAQALLKGICDPDVDPDGTVSAYIRDKKTYSDALKFLKLEETGIIRREPIMDPSSYSKKAMKSTEFTREAERIMKQTDFCSSPKALIEYYSKNVE